MSKHVDADALLAALYEADAISARGAKIIREFPAVYAEEVSKALLRELAAYEDAEEQGWLVRLPCKVGDTVYAIHEERIYEVFVIGFNVYEWTKGFQICLLFDSRKTNGTHLYPIDDFGRNVFLTREEAEAALKGETEGETNEH